MIYYNWLPSFSLNQVSATHGSQAACGSLTALLRSLLTQSSDLLSAQLSNGGCQPRYQGGNGIQKEVMTERGTGPLLRSEHKPPL